MSRIHRGSLALAFVLSFAGLADTPAFAGTFEKTVNFALDEWIEIASTDGPCTIHRIRLARQSGFTKSRFMRPGNSDFLADVQIQIDFTNDSTKDWEVELEFEWMDADGKAIDGFRGSEGLDAETKHDEQTVTLSTLKYGLDRAKRIRIKGTYERD